ncbi:MAG: hypothetical protein QOD77_1965 [Thermoplasmata archaeon]|jgi:hypothetical protein|nr:hypothetical protein [Thermoplasmata archaeon]
MKSRIFAFSATVALLLPMAATLAPSASALTAPVYVCPDGTWDLIRTAGGTHAINVFQKRQSPAQVATRVPVSVAIGWEHANDFSKILQTIEIDSNLGGSHTTVHRTFVNDNDFFQDACGTPIKFNMGDQLGAAGWIDITLHNSLLVETKTSSTTFASSVEEFTSTSPTGTVMAKFTPTGIGGTEVSYSETRTYGSSFARSHESGASVAVTATLYTAHTVVVVGGGPADYVTDQVDYLAGEVPAACKSGTEAPRLWTVDSVQMDPSRSILAWRLSDGADGLRYGWTVLPTASPGFQTPNFFEAALASDSGDETSTTTRSTDACGDLSASDTDGGTLTFKWLKLADFEATRAGSEGAWVSAGVDLQGAFDGDAFALDAVSTTYSTQPATTTQSMSASLGESGTWAMARGAVRYESGVSSVTF